MENKTNDVSSANPTEPLTQIASKFGNMRWRISALLFFAATINYLDRQVISILKPTLETELGWTEIDYGWIVFAFQAAYAVGYLGVGWFLDRVGTRIGFMICVTVWSFAAMGHSLARTVTGFSAARMMLALGESGSTPAIIKTIAEWFPKKERAFATGINNAGANIGALLAPILVPWLTLSFGWEWAFIVTGALGFIWLVFWFLFYRRPEEHPNLSKQEFDYIHSDPPEEKVEVSWFRLLFLRQTWAFILGKFMTDPIWYVFLFWIPDFLHKKHNLGLKDFGLPLFAVYVIADLGSIVGGWISSALIGRGWALNPARKTAALICAFAVVPIIFASQVSSLWAAIIIIGIAGGAHQGWSANIFTMISDVFPKPLVASVVGISGTAGAVGGMLIALLVGWILETTGSYLIIFVIAAFAYLGALAVVQLIIPRLEPVRVLNKDGELAG